MTRCGGNEIGSIVCLALDGSLLKVDNRLGWAEVDSPSSHLFSLIVPGLAAAVNREAKRGAVMTEKRQLSLDEFKRAVKELLFSKPEPSAVSEDHDPTPEELEQVVRVEEASSHDQ